MEEHPNIVTNIIMYHKLGLRYTLLSLNDFGQVFEFKYLLTVKTNNTLEKRYSTAQAR